MDWKEQLADWGLKVPDAGRVKRAKNEVVSTLNMWNTPDGEQELTCSTSTNQRISVWPAGHPDLKGRNIRVFCSCPDFRNRQMVEGKACKHITGLAMHLENGGYVSQAGSSPAAPAMTQAERVRAAIARAIAKKAQEVQKLLEKGRSPLLWGTTGTGKTAAVHAATLALNGQTKSWKIQEVAGSEGWLDADLIGSWTPQRTWAWGPVGRAFDQAHGTDGTDGEYVVLFIDEITRFSTRALDILMRAVQPMDARVARASGLDVPQGIDAVYVIESPLMGFRAWAPVDHLVWIAAGNPWVNPLDIALLRRFHPVEYGFDEEVAHALADPEVAKMVLTLWKSYEDQELPLPLEYQALAESETPQELFTGYLNRLKCVDRMVADATKTIIESTNRKWVN